MSESMVVPASALSELRALNAATMPHTCTIYRKTATRAPGGVTTYSYLPVVGDSLACRLAAVAATERVQAEQPVTAHEWTLILVTNTGVTLALDDRIRVVGETDGVAWDVTVRALALPEPHAFRTTTRIRVTDVDVVPITG